MKGEAVLTVDELFFGDWHRTHKLPDLFLSLLVLCFQGSLLLFRASIQGPMEHEMGQETKVVKSHGFLCLHPFGAELGGNGLFLTALLTPFFVSARNLERMLSEQGISAFVYICR